MRNDAFRWLGCIILAIAMAGCGATKKVVESTTDEANAMQMQCKSDSVAYAKTIVDTTTTEKGVTLYTEIVFASVDTARTPQPEVTVGNDGIIQVKGGNIQSIRQYAHANEKTNVGKAETEAMAHIEHTDSVAAIHDAHKAVKEQHADKSASWRILKRIISTVVLLAIIMCMMIYRNAIAGWWGKIIGGIFRIFK